MQPRETGTLLILWMSCSATLHHSDDSEPPTSRSARMYISRKEYVDHEQHEIKILCNLFIDYASQSACLQSICSQ